jgi:hypothetical protein
MPRRAFIHVQDCTKRGAANVSTSDVRSRQPEDRCDARGRRPQARERPPGRAGPQRTARRAAARRRAPVKRSVPVRPRTARWAARVGRVSCRCRCSRMRGDDDRSLAHVALRRERRCGAGGAQHRRPQQRERDDHRGQVVERLFAPQPARHEALAAVGPARPARAAGNDRHRAFLVRPRRPIGAASWGVAPRRGARVGAAAASGCEPRTRRTAGTRARGRAPRGASGRVARPG